MILLEKDTVNIVALSLTELSELPQPYWVLVFKPDLLSEPARIVHSADSSPFPRRWNKLTIIDTMVTGSDGLQGEVDLPQGWGTYSVYESTAPTIDLAQTTGRVLEVGRYYVLEQLLENVATELTNVYL